MSVALPPKGTPAWYVRERQLADGRWVARCHIGPQNPDGHIVDGSDPEGGGPEARAAYRLWTVDVNDHGDAVIQINPLSVPGVPPIWLASMPDEGERPSTTLVAFGSDHFQPGTVIGNATFFTVPVQSESQWGAIRWYRDGVVDQLYVTPEMRGRRLGTVLIYCAAAYHKHLGLETVIRSDGRRTDDGVQLLSDFQHPDRIAALTHLMPSMDPDDD